MSKLTEKVVFAVRLPTLFWR